MDATIATDAVRQVLQQIQASQQLACPVIVDAIRPIRDLKNFDSPMSIAATGMVGRKLGLKIDPKTNIFGNKKGLHTIEETVALLCKLADEQKVKEPAKA
jgi:hypothetical protein